MSSGTILAIFSVNCYKLNKLKMKKVLILSIAVLFAAACSNNPGQKSSENQEGKIEVTESNVEEYDPHRGEGKFTELEISPSLDKEMANKGESIFSVKCGSCHKLSDERLVGPGFKGVTERRTGTWMMNFLTNTDEMIDLDPELQAQLEICMVRMPNQNLTDEDARSIYEFLRKNDGVN